MSDSSAVNLSFPPPPFVPTRPPETSAAQPGAPAETPREETPRQEAPVPEPGGGDPVAEAIAGRLEEIAAAFRSDGVEGMLARGAGAAPGNPLEILLVGYALGYERAAASDEGAESLG